MPNDSDGSRAEPADVLDERERLRITLSSIGDAVITTDARGVVTFMNPVAEALTGWTLDESVGRALESVFKIVNEETRAAVENPAAKTLAEGVIVGLANHTLLIAKDGTERPIDDSSAPILSQSGETTGVVLVFRDVTEQRRNEKILRESEARFRLLVDNVQDYAIFMLDPRGHVMSWNAGAERIKGYRAHEIIGRHFSCFYPSGVAATFPQQQLDQAALEGRYENEDWRIRKDGTKFWANAIITALRDERGALKGFAKITRDLTERKAAEDELRAREQRFRALTESANDAIIAASEDGTIIAWNHAATSLFQYTTQEALGQPLTIVVPERYRQMHEAGWNRLRATGQSRITGKTLELAGRRKDGSELPIELSLASWSTSEGRFFAGIIRDVSERRQKEQALRQAEVLADLNHRKDEFLAMLSHELRNPLAPISAAVQVLKSSKQTAATREQATAILERQVAHLTRLVDDLLKISHIATGRIGLQQERIDVRQVVERAVEAVRPLIDERKHELTIAVPNEPSWLYADPVRLEQVLANLLTNAAKYTDPGGHIRLRAEAQGNEVVLCVVDDGCGIASDFLPSVFEPFTRGDAALTRAQSGLGVGLAIVKRIVEMHAGSVAARSEGVGRGSEFVVRLPLAEPMQAKAARTTIDPDQRAVPRSSVLVVDDNVDAADSIAMLLRHTGHEVFVAYSGQAALDAARACQPEAILLDIGMPDMDGYEVARRVRRDPSLQKIRLVALTGHGRDKDQHRAQLAGFDAYLVKPADPQKIQELFPRFARRR